jgi:DNA segregation ATPase FtsK/SpoIIIE, S-DNA-T family
MVVVGLFVLLAEIGVLGPVGHGISVALECLFGLARWFIPVALLGVAVALLFGKLEVERLRLGFGVGIGLVALSGLGHFVGSEPSLHASAGTLGRAGGWLGVLVGGGLQAIIGFAGALVVLVALLILSILLLTGLTLRAFAHLIVAGARAVGGTVGKWWYSRPQTPANDPVIVPLAVVPEPNFDDPPVFVYDDDPVQFAEDEVDERAVVVPLPAAPRAKKRASALRAVGTWTLPSMELLQRVREQRHDRAAIDAAGDELVNALAAHGVETTLVGYTVGPTVTRFELELGPGVKVARVTSLHRDIAYAMASPDVRILAPIPGRSAIGVEVPNRQRSLVALGDLLATEESIGATHPLDVPLGRDISGKTVVVNLADMPHVLISGATGAGKSSCINSLITSLVMRSTPDELRLILIDPKRVELGQYNDLPHLLSPVVVDPKKAASTLTWAVKEMERRYDILAQYQVRDIASYQHLLASGEIATVPSVKANVADAVERASGLTTEIDEPDAPEVFPYVVIVVDELNDLMMVAARDVEDSVVRIAQMARAVGIHLVLATQRPSVDVITGVIKANIPSRMAFAVSSLADSRVILDQAGAERLIGKGDMLLLTASSNVARRLQSPWVSEDEVRRVVAAWRSQGGVTESTIAVDVPGLDTGELGGLADEDDEVMLARARDLVIRTQSGSVSMLQRKLRVGFARAGRLMDELERENVVAAGEGSKSRRVLVSLDTYEATLEKRSS